MVQCRRVNRKPWRICFTAFVAAALLLGGAGLHLISGGHIPEYLTWRWMVTFHVAVAPVDDFRIEVDKSERRLAVFEGGREIAVYRAAISEHGMAQRTTWEDELTPEGIFLIASMQYESRYGPRQMLLETTAQSLTDYEAQYGEEGRDRVEVWSKSHGPLDTIWETYDFNQMNPEHPMWNDILIHGGGSATDWTWGCIALDDADVIELFDLLRRSRAGGLGVAVEIRR
ncbi:MAG: L,D-transpeptidase [Anaerolineales bacterium]|nr:L,D-transpeptidase [Anaerolineales bacterium]